MNWTLHWKSVDTMCTHRHWTSCSSPIAKQISNVSLEYKTYLDPDRQERVFYMFENSHKVRKSDVSSMSEDFRHEYDTILCGEMSNVAKRNTAEQGWQVLYEADYILDKCNSPYAHTFQVLTEDETLALLKKLSCKKQSLPSIRADDAMVKYLGFPVHAVVHVKRGFFETYRHVCK
jgi:DNA-directed RNA polymerase subunit H (RpoH/RPB5)